MDRSSIVRRVAMLGAIALAAGAAQARDITLLNVSYDPTREFYVDFNKAFAAHWTHNRSPYTSTIVFLVRKGNPKNIKDWNYLAA